MGEPSASKAPGTELGSYRILRLLGEGGMAQVYLAEHVKLGRKVAIKLLLDDLAERETLAARFFAEARAVNAIRSEHIVDITDFVEEGEEKYFVMEYLEGPSLWQAMQRGHFPLERTLDIALQLARTLEVVHGAGILHRDLKPDNIILVERGGRSDFVKLLDFGVAKFMDEASFERSGLANDTQDGLLLGTPAYLAPESLMGEDVDYRADVYSFGVLLFQMITGKRPFRSKSLPELVYKQMHEPPPSVAELDDVPYEVPEALDSLVRRCLEKDPMARPGTISHVVYELELLCETLGIYSRPALTFDEKSAAQSSERLPVLEPVPAGDEVPVAPASRRTTLVAAGLGALLVVGGGIAVALVGGGEEEAGQAVASPQAAAPSSSRVTERDARLARIEAGEAAAVLASLDEGAAAPSAADQRVRGHALAALERIDEAWQPWALAAGGGAVDDAMLDRAFLALEERKAEGAMSVLAAWPDERAKQRLLALLDAPGWWPRHHALKILDELGQGGAVDRERLAIVDLDTGPNCGTRKFGLKKLAEHGKSEAALAALERASKRRDNGCLKKELRQARDAVEARSAP